MKPSIKGVEMDRSERFRRLLEPGTIGTLELRNRIVMCPMGLLYGNEDGSVSENEAAYYEARARGGTGLVIIGTACVAYPHGTNHRRMPAVSDDRYLPGMIDLATRVHAHGGRVAAQLNFMGTYSFIDMEEGRKRMVPYDMPAPAPDRISTMVSAAEAAAAASSFMAPGAALGYHVVDEADIAWVVERYADAAERCMRAGYDGVELHAGHGYLIDEFLSPRNTRTDGWGGGIEGRARLLIEIIRAVRARVGRDYPLWIRINAVERHHTVGESFDEQCQAIDMAIAEGIDAVHLTAYANTNVATGPVDSYAPHVVGPLADYAAQLRARIDVPVITFGRFEPDEAEAVLAEGKADFIAMGRKLLADADLANKLAEDRADDIRPCIYQYRCIGNIFVKQPARCVVNPQTGLEHDRQLMLTDSPRHVLVIGGGVAGMEVARLLNLRGHRVTLREASPRLGGMLNDAAIADPNLGSYLAWQIRQLEQTDVDVQVGAPVTAASVPADVDEIVIATGAVWGAPDVEGRQRIITLDQLRSWLHNRDDSVGQRVVVLGASKAAASLAELASQRGHQVTLISTESYIAGELGLPGRFRLAADLDAAGVPILTNTSVVRITDDGVVAITGDDERLIPADTVIGLQPTAGGAGLAAELAVLGKPIHAIGDSDHVAFIEGATNGAFTTATSIG